MWHRVTPATSTAGASPSEPPRITASSLVRGASAVSHRGRAPPPSEARRPHAGHRAWTVRAWFVFSAHVGRGSAHAGRWWWARDNSGVPACAGRAGGAPRPARTGPEHPRARPAHRPCRGRQDGGRPGHRRARGVPRRARAVARHAPRRPGHTGRRGRRPRRLHIGERVLARARNTGRPRSSPQSGRLRHPRRAARSAAERRRHAVPRSAHPRRRLGSHRASSCPRPDPADPCRARPGPAGRRRSPAHRRRQRRPAALRPASGPRRAAGHRRRDPGGVRVGPGRGRGAAAGRGGP